MPEGRFILANDERQLWLQYNALFLNLKISVEDSAQMADEAVREYRARNPSIQIGPKP